MDYMDIDHVEVPDTPDRLIARNINGRGCAENEIGSSVPTHSGCTELLDEGARNQLSNRSKQATDNGLSRRPPYSLPGKSLSISKKPECDGDFTTSLGNSSSSRNTYLFRRRVPDKSANHGKDCFLDSHLKEKGNSLCASQPSILGESAVVDLTEQHGTFHTFQNPSSDRALEDRYTRGIRRGATSTHGFPSLNHRGKCPIATHASFKGKEKIDDACKGGLVVDHGKGVYGDSQPKPGKNISASFRSIPFPRASGQKRLVRNGCISPHNIAKAKQLAEDQSNGFMDVQNDKEPVVSDFSSSVIRDLIAEDNTSLKGQAGRSYLFSSKEACTNSISTRPFSSHGEDGRGNSNSNGDAFRHFEGLSGWRNTRNRTERVNFPPSHDDDHLPQTKDDSCFLNQPIGKRVMERQNGGGSSSRISNDKDKDHNAASFWLGSTPPVSQPVSVPISHSQVNGRRTSTLLKRQKQGSASGSNGESSKLTSVDSDIVFLGSSGEPTNPESNRTQRGHGIGNLDPIIEIDALSPEMQHGLPHNTGCINNDDTDARSRQIEADEMLARELQEQLYNEVPGVGDGEIDAHIELALHQADSSRHAFSGRSPPVFHPRDSVFSNLYRQSQSRTSQNPTARRGIQARGPTSRLTRMRNRLPSQSARVSYRERSSLFPPNMDVDMRIHILEALEAFSDMEMVGNFLQDDREFNENDYEMLLALDENNHQHGGASLDQINILPQSIVQGDNFEEACAICLETPSSGDTIRHLPCLHKFHKDCIDPWLRRRTSCPVCKSSIT